MKPLKSIVNFLFELRMLKHQKHTGVILTGVQSPDSLADHCLRASLIAYILGELEGARAEKCAMMCLIHDLPETRVGDHHKVGARYLDTKEAEKNAFLDQLRNLPLKIQKDWYQLYNEKIKRNTKEGIIAQDADWLEAALSAREFVSQGYSGMQNWIDNVRKALETKSAKKILAIIEKTDFNEWWRDLKKMTYKKLK